MSDTVVVVLDRVICPRCGLVFGLDGQRIQQLRENHTDFWCPNGHPLVYRGETEAERLKRQVVGLEATITAVRAQRDSAERSVTAYKGQATRIANRVRAGLCPFCRRSFANVRRHISSKHPKQERYQNIT